MSTVEEAEEDKKIIPQIANISFGDQIFTPNLCRQYSHSLPNKLKVSVSSTQISTGNNGIQKRNSAQFGPKIPNIQIPNRKRASTGNNSSQLASQIKILPKPQQLQQKQTQQQQKQLQQQPQQKQQQQLQPPQKLPEKGKFIPNEISNISYQKNMEQPQFNDDQPIFIPKNKLPQQQKDNDDLKKNLHLDVRCKSKNVQLGLEPSYQPTMITLRTEDQEDEDPKQKLPQQKSKQLAKDQPTVNTRTQGIDLICVIDHSGSMKGAKIELVRQTLHYVITLLTDIDRLCLVQFDKTCHRMSPFITLTHDNKIQMNKIISALNVGGGSNITLGMNCAFECLKQRRSENSVSSIFLLSDGQDNGAAERVAASFFKNYQSLADKTFTIYSFGFGKAHDSTLMSEIANLRDGNFYFIEDVTKLDECFVDALGSLFSIVVQNVSLTIELVQTHTLIKPECHQTFGNMWIKKAELIYQIDIPQLMSGVSKDFMMELLIPAFNDDLSDNQRNIEVIKLSLTGVVGDKQFSMTKNLMLTLFDKDEAIGELEEDGEVMENYCRVQAALAMKGALEWGNHGNYEQGRKLVDIAIQKIESCKMNKQINQIKLESLQRDLQLTKNQCNSAQFNQNGKHTLTMMQKSHMEQKSKGNTQQNDQEEVQSYTNSKQRCMQQDLTKSKQ